MNEYINDLRKAKSIRVLRPVLDRLVNQRILTPDGRDWLVCALDPFHDYLHELAGYPDQDGSLTIVERFTDQTTVGHPVGLADGATWDCLVFNVPAVNFTFYENPNWVRELPIFHNNVNNAGSIDNDSTHTHADTALHPLNIWSAASAAALDFVPKVATTVPGSWAAGESVGLQCIPTALQGKRVRLIGQGFEVHNTTAELYQSGTVTTGRVPQTTTRDVRLYQRHAGAAPTNLVDDATFIMNPPPANADEAIRYTDSQSWEAKHGCYAHCTLAGVENPILAGEQRNVFMRTQGDIDGVCLTSAYDINTGSATGSTIRGGVQNFANTNTHYALFHGLHKDTTLNVMCRSYTEHTPRVDDALLPLAKPSAEYDIHALQLYSAVVNHLPPAVMVEMNARGRFAKMIGGILTAAAPILGLTLGPEMAAAAVVGGTALEATGAAVARNAKNQPAKQTRAKKGPTTVVVTQRK